MKRLVVIVLCFIGMRVAGQNRLIVAGNTNAIYITITITGTQSLSTLSDQYNIPLSVLSKLNGLKINAALRKGDELKVPLTRDNFFQHHIFGKFQPVYHLSKTNETLTGIAIKFNDIAVDTLKIWNSIADENIPVNKAIVVGFVTNKKAIPVSAAYQAIAYDTIPNPNILDAFKFGAKELKGELKPKPLPVPAAPARVPVINSVATNTMKPATGLPASITEHADKTAPIATKPANASPTLIQTESDFNYRPRNNDEGYFEHIYLAKVKDRAYQALTGDASIFKTISGWKDRKYYVLINEVVPGTIVRVTAANKKSICAKVLGPLPETKGASGIFIRLSNAAAAALGITDQRFIVSITYVEY